MLLCAVIAGVGVLGMMTVTCVDIVLRAFHRPLVGALDLVQILGCMTLAGALPYTTAVKGHVAIEYFFQKLPRPGRILVDTLTRLCGITLFVLLAWRSYTYGLQLQARGVGTATLQIPLYWIPWVISFTCGVVALVIWHNLTHPGRAMMEP